MRLLLALLVNAAALWVATRFIDGITYSGTLPGLLGVALVFGVVNTLVRPVAAFFSLPLQLITLGLFTFVLNAAMLLLTGWLARGFGLGFAIDGWWPAMLGAIVVGVVSSVLSWLLKDDDDE